MLSNLLRKKSRIRLFRDARDPFFSLHLAGVTKSRLLTAKIPNMDMDAEDIQRTELVCIFSP